MKQERELIIEEPADILQNKEREKFFQIDVLKATMIFLVIFDHFVYWDVKSQIGAALWERISIPIFLIIMGFNMGRSFQRNGAITLKQLYSWDYFKKKFWRYIMPFFILYLVSMFTGWIMYGFDFIAMYDGQYYPEWGIINLFTGIFLFWGPGSWFIPVIIQSIFLLPLIYWLFTKSRVLALLLCFVVEIVMQLIVFTVIGDITSWEERHILNLFMTSIPFYLSAIGFGVWFSFGYGLFEKRNLIIWILFPLSLTYLIAYQFFNFRIRLFDVPLLRGDYHFLVFPYSAMLFLIIMKLLPQKANGRLPKWITTISNATYHILLIQIFGFGMMIPWFGTHYVITGMLDYWDIINLLLVWAIFIPVGVAWYKIDRIKEWKKRLIRSLIFFPTFIILINLLFLFSYVT